MADILNRSYTQKEWTELIESMLIYLSENDPEPTSKVYLTDRQLLPGFYFLHD